MKKRISLITTAFLLTFCFALPLVSLAQSGSLDLSFDTDGMVTTPIGTDNDHARSIAIQSDGKIVLAGTSLNGSDFDFALVRYNTNGSLDNTFDTDGIVTASGGASSQDIAYAVAVQPDGKIVVAGRGGFMGINNVFTILRYNTNGSLDSTFDMDGIVSLGSGAASSLAIQQDGKIVVAGGIATSGIGLVRCNSNGSLDSTFDIDGIVNTSVGSSHTIANSVVIQVDGKIIVAGYSDDASSNDDIVLVRYNANGSLDNSFNTDGVVTTPVGTSADFAHSAAIQSDGKIVVTGKSYNGSDYDIVLVRYNTNGSLDNAFDIDGIVPTSVGTAADLANALVIQGDGKIVVAGASSNGATDDFAILRYNTNGSLDNTFDTDGIVTTTIGTSGDLAMAVALQSDGKIVAAGKSNSLPLSDFALVRYNNTFTIGLSETVNENAEINIYPNPFSKHAVMRSENILQDATLIIYNCYGQAVKEIINISGQALIISRDYLASGLYFLLLTQDSKVLSTNKLVITD